MDLILVININVSGLSKEDVPKYMEKIKKNIEDKTHKFMCFFVPITVGDTKVECINPVLLDKKEYNLKVSKILVDYQLKLEEYLNKPNKKINKPVCPPTQMIKEDINPKKNLKTSILK